MRFTVLCVSLAALTLAACGSESEPAAEESAAVAAATPTPLPTQIPAAYQGRWGLSADACTEEDSEGLLEVTATELRFYESVATLDAVTGATGDRFRGHFAFTGEGEEWERDVVLDLRDDGEVLVRRHFGEGATPEPFNYTRCP